MLIVQVVCSLLAGVNAKCPGELSRNQPTRATPPGGLEGPEVGAITERRREMDLSNISGTTTMLIAAVFGLKLCWQFVIGSIRDVLKGWLNTCPEVIIDLRIGGWILVYRSPAS
jgi:hypothetical protein